MRCMKFGLLFTLSALLFGCGDDEHDTAEYLGYTQSHVKMTSLENAGKLETYIITWFIKSETGGQTFHLMALPDILPAISKKISFVAPHLKSMGSDGIKYPKHFVEASEFGWAAQSTYTDSKTKPKHVLWNGQEVGPCITFEGQFSRDVFCSGMGLVEGRGTSLGTVVDEKLIYWEPIDDVQKLEAQVVIYYWLATGYMLPEDEHDGFAAWVEACPKIFNPESSLSVIDMARSCSCVYERDKEKAKAAAKHAHLPAPLGHGSDAVQFNEIISQCSSQAQAGLEWYLRP